MKVAMITGVTGQDGAYLAEFLLKKGYEVHGIKRRSSSFNTHRIDHLYLDEHEHQGRLHMHFGDLADASRLTNLIWQLRPDEVYHLAAQSHVKVSFDEPEYTGDVTALVAPLFEIESTTRGRNSTIDRKRAYFWSVLGDPTLRLTRPPDGAEVAGAVE